MPTWLRSARARPEPIRAQLPERLSLLRSALGVCPRGSGDEIREDGHCLDVARLREPGQAKRVERVPREQAQVGIHPAERPRLAVMHEIALVDGLEHEPAG